MEKLERQLRLLATLLHTDRPLMASEIQAQVEYPADKTAFRRAFERDKEDLRSLGVPLEVASSETSDGPVASYQIRKDDYYLHDLDLAEDEVIALSMALRLISLEGADTADAVWKLGGAANETHGDVPVAAITMGPAVATVHQAIADRAPISFEYRDESRSVEPWRLSYRRGRWYLDGFDVHRDGERQFRLDRIVGAVEPGAPGTALRERPEPADEREPWQFAADEQPEVVARVHIDAGLASWVQRQLGEDRVVSTGDDGSIEVELDVSNVPAFRSLVLGWGTHAEVVAPAHLRQDMIDWLEALL